MGMKASKLRRFNYKRIGYEAAPSSSTPRGYVPICVGVDGDTRQFMVHTAVLGDGEFTEMLRRSAEEYGFCYQGVLRIRCQAAEFEEWLGGRAERREMFRRVLKSHIGNEM